MINNTNIHKLCNNTLKLKKNEKVCIIKVCMLKCTLETFQNAWKKKL